MQTFYMQMMQSIIKQPITQSSHLKPLSDSKYIQTHLKTLQISLCHITTQFNCLSDITRTIAKITLKMFVL